MNSVVVLLVTISGSKVSAETAFEIFAADVHPLLTNRCADCHGSFQFPFHSLPDAGESYPDAVKTINLNFPDTSALWIRSYNNHCGNVAKCGEQVPELMEAIKVWAAQEREEQIREDVFTEIATAVAPIPAEVNTTEEFYFDGLEGEKYWFEVTRLSESTIFIANPRSELLGSNMSHEGFELRSLDVQTQSQNFRDQKVTAKAAQEKLEIGAFGSGYVIAILPDQNMSEMKVTFATNNLKLGITLDRVKELFDQGYFVPYSQRFHDPKIIQLEASLSNSCALFENGRVKCWGTGSGGNNGNQRNEDIGDQPNEMGFDLNYINFGTDEKVISLAVGSYHNCALFENGKVKCWGQNFYGHLGYGDTNNRGFAPGQMGEELKFLDLGTELRAVKITISDNSSCVILEDGSAKCWGDNFYGQLGLGDKNYRGDQPDEMGEALPFMDFGTSEKITSISIGTMHGCASFADGKAKCWGSKPYLAMALEQQNDYLGDEPDEMGENLPYLDLGTDLVKEIHVEALWTCALMVNNKMKCWGDGLFGKMGQGQESLVGNTITPKDIPYMDFGDHTVKSFAMGYAQGCVLLDNDKYKCWGYNLSGNLGYGDTNNRGDQPDEMGDNLPYVNFGPNVIAVSPDRDHTCILTKNGRAKCFGLGNSGRLGYEDTQSKMEANKIGENLPFIDVGQDLIL